jgi:hypothetical protein
MDKLNNYKSKPLAIVGSTTINHEARTRLGLNCSEYCLLDFLYRKQQNKERSDSIAVYVSTGFTEQEIITLFKGLIQKSFIMTSGGEYTLTSKWAEGFADIEKEFDEYFWNEKVPKKPGSTEIIQKVAWTGTKKKAIEYYVKLRKKYSKDFLVSQRDNYFEYLKLQKQYRGFDQQRLMCQVFLNPANERFLEDYADYINTLNEKYAPAPVIEKPLTKDDVLGMYSKQQI